MIGREAAEMLAIQALGFLAGDGERLQRFLAVTGLEQQELRAAAQEPNFLAGVLEHITADEDLLLAFAGDAGIEPDGVMRARGVLAGPDWQREVP
jgi:hypothetical protein